MVILKRERHYTLILLKITRLVNTYLSLYYQVLGRYKNKIRNTLAVPFLIRGSETWTIKNTDKSTITAAEITFIRRVAKLACMERQ
jgi:hypothetical protein